jgi:DNA-binding MarR family transcriptional regulator
MNFAVDTSLPDILYHDAPTVDCIADSPVGLARCRRLIEAAGARPRAAADVAGSDTLADLAAPSAIVVDLTVDTGAPMDALLARLARGSREMRRPGIVMLPPELIDVASGATIDSDIVLLCAADDAECVGAIALALATPSPDVLHDRAEETSPQLRRLSEEVGRIARALAELSSSERPTPPPPAAVRPPVESWPSVAAVRALLRARRLRDQYFDAELFADPAWDMLLDLMLARLERRMVAVSSLCIAAAVPPTTALRWIKKLSDVGLFIRHADPRDGRRIFIDLSDDAAEGVAGYFAALARMNVNLG